MAKPVKHQEPTIKSGRKTRSTTFTIYNSLDEKKVFLEARQSQRETKKENRRVPSAPRGHERKAFGRSWDTPPKEREKGKQLGVWCFLFSCFFLLGR